MVEQPLQILSGSDHQALDIGLVQAAQPEPAQAMEHLGFAEERLQPDLPLPQRPLVGWQLTVALHSVDVGLIEGAEDVPAVGAGSALALDRAGIADGSLGLVDEDVVAITANPEAQLLALGTDIAVIDRVIGERLGGQVASALAEVRKGHEGADAVVLQALDVFDGPVGSVAGGMAGSESPAEARPAHQIQHGTVFHYRGRRHQGGQDDARLTAVHYVVVVVAQSGAGARGRFHEAGIGVAGTVAGVRAPDVAVLPETATAAVTVGFHQGDEGRGLFLSLRLGWLSRLRSLPQFRGRSNWWRFGKGRDGLLG